MKKVTVWALIALVLVTWSPAVLLAGNCRVVRRNVVVQRRAVVKQVVVKQAVAAVAVVPVVTAVLPLYSAFYAGSAAYPATATATAATAARESSGTDAELIRVLQALDQRLQTLEGAAGVRPGVTVRPSGPIMPQAREQEAPTDDTAALLGLFKQNCAVCHDASVAGSKGGKFILTTGGGLAPLSAEQRLNVIDRTYAGEMPPPKNPHNIAPLNDEQQALLISLLTKRR